MRGYFCVLKASARRTPQNLVLPEVSGRFGPSSLRQYLTSAPRLAVRQSLGPNPTTCQIARSLCTASALLITFCCVVSSTLTPKAPNFQYFERPKYRYPYYDEKGVGRLLYGYGDDKLYQYKTFTPLEGIH